MAEPTFSAFGEYIRAQRRMAQLSLRELANLTRVSNPYLSQIERGLHQPSVTVLKSIAEALNLSVENVLAQAAGLADAEGEDGTTTEDAIRADARLSNEQKEALLAVYRGFVQTPSAPSAASSSTGAASAAPASARSAAKKPGTAKGKKAKAKPAASGSRGR